MTPDTCHITWDGDTGKVAAIIECMIPDARHAVRDGNTGRLTTVRECTIPDARHAICNLHSFYRGYVRMPRCIRRIRIRRIILHRPRAGDFKNAGALIHRPSQIIAAGAAIGRCRSGECQGENSDAKKHQRQEKFCACFHHVSFSLSEKVKRGKARRRAQNKKCAAGRLRTKNAGLHLLPHNHFAWYALYVEEREKRDRIFTEKNALYLHIALFDCVARSV